jgi:hypothetical protein
MGRARLNGFRHITDEMADAASRFQNTPAADERGLTLTIFRP